MDTADETDDTIEHWPEKSRAEREVSALTGETAAPESARRHALSAAEMVDSNDNNKSSRLSRQHAATA